MPDNCRPGEDRKYVRISRIRSKMFSAENPRSKQVLNKNKLSESELREYLSEYFDIDTEKRCQ
jgi:hypothetical protein